MKYKIEILSPLLYRDMLDGWRVKLTEPFIVRVNDDLIDVPAGFVSDLASVPWFFRRLLPCFGPWNAAAVVHDWLYVTGKIDGRAITQREADSIMYAMMRSLPAVPRFKAWLIFAGLRLGGLSAWMSYRKGKQQ